MTRRQCEIIIDFLKHGSWTNHLYSTSKSGTTRMRRSARKQVDELSTKNIVQHGKLTEHGVNELINYLIKNKLDVFHFHETKFKRI